jgi:hypothetical protein
LQALAHVSSRLSRSTGFHLRARPALGTHRPMSELTLPGNHYRAVDFEKGIVWIKWIGRRRDYDKIDVKEVQHGD